jgi:hypothetical protein
VQPVSDLLQKLVAAVMAMKIIDALEVIEIEHDHGEPFPLALEPGDRLGKALVEQFPAGRAGQRVPLRLVQ